MASGNSQKMVLSAVDSLAEVCMKRSCLFRKDMAPSLMLTAFVMGPAVSIMFSSVTADCQIAWLNNSGMLSLAEELSL
jgi:Ni/Fe-hydrogenase subunit HybB-like protein